MLAVEVVGKGYRLNGAPVEPNALVREVREAKAKAPEVRAVVRADRRASYGEVINAIDLVKQAGVAKLALPAVPADPVTVMGLAPIRPRGARASTPSRRCP